MALNFPNNPSVGDVYEDSASGFSYQWDGTFWKSYKVDISDSLGGNLDADLILNSNDISGTGNINITGVVTATSFDGGTATFSSDVDIGTGGTTAFFDVSTGRVGVGTISPGRTLDVNGVIRSDGTSGGLAFGGNSSTPSEGAAIYRPANSTLAFVTDSSERMRLDSAGNVGIGTISPATDISGSAQGLSVAHSNVAFLSIENTAASGKRYTLYANDSGSLVTYDEDANAARMLIDSSGNLGLGTVSPSRKLHVASSFIRVDDGYGLDSSGSTEKVVLDNGFISLTTNSLEQIRIVSSGKVGIGTTNPNSTLNVVADSSANGLTIQNRTADDYGYLRFQNNAGTEAQAYIGCQRVGTNAGDLLFETAGSERMRLTSAGRLGINVAAPNAILEIGGIANSGQTEAFTIDRADGTQLFSIDYNQSVQEVSFSGNNKKFVIKNKLSSVESLRIDESGRMLVGTDSAATAGQAQYGFLRTIGNTLGPSSYGIISVGRGAAASSGLAGGNNMGTITFTDSIGGEFARIQAATDGTTSSSSYLGNLRFYTTASGSTSTTERMRITSDGVIKTSNTNTYVGATGDYNEINYSGNSASLILAARSSSTPFGYYYQSTDADPNNTSNYVFRALQNTGVNIYTIWSNGSVSARSDARYKKNIETARDGYLEDLSQLRVVKYNWYNHEDDAPKELGLVAQEVEEVFPGLVLNEPEQDAEGNDTGEVCKSIKFSVFTPMLVKALQEAHARIEQLETRLAALENG